LGIELLIAAPCTAPTKASESAGTIRAPTNDRSGNTGVGSAWGTSVRSRRISTAVRSSIEVSADVTAIATTMPSGSSLVRSSITISSIVRPPTITADVDQEPTLRAVSMARRIRLGPSLA